MFAIITIWHPAMARVYGIGIVCGFVSCIVAASCAKRCPDISLFTGAGLAATLEMNCSKYLHELGVAEMYMPMHSDLESWPLCSDLRVAADNDAVQQCMCPPGFTDAVYGDSTLGLGKLQGLKNIDIARISCKQACPAPYQSIARLADTAACACWSRRGCVFEERSLLQLAESRQVQQAVLMLADNLVSDSFIVFCRQPQCAQRVSPQDLMVCATQGIEYTYCDECPAECLKSHRSCSIHPTTRFCSVMCDSGYVRTASPHNATYDCALKQTCPAHQYHNDSVDIHGNILLQQCAPCPAGHDNANSYGEVLSFHSYKPECLVVVCVCLFCTESKRERDRGGHRERQRERERDGDTERERERERWRQRQRK